MTCKHRISCHAHFTYFQRKVHVGEDDSIVVWLRIWLRKRLTWDTNPGLWGESPVFDPSNYPTSSNCGPWHSLNY